MHAHVEWQIALAVAQALDIDQRRQPLRRLRRWALYSVAYGAMMTSYGQVKVTA